MATRIRMRSSSTAAGALAVALCAALLACTLPASTQAVMVKKGSGSGDQQQPGHLPSLRAGAPAAAAAAEQLLPLAGFYQGLVYQGNDGTAYNVSVTIPGPVGTVTLSNEYLQFECVGYITQLNAAYGMVYTGSYTVGHDASTGSYSCLSPVAFTINAEQQKFFITFSLPSVSATGDLITQIL